MPTRATHSLLSVDRAARFAPAFAAVALLWCVYAGFRLWTTPVHWIGLTPSMNGSGQELTRVAPFATSWTGMIRLAIPVGLAGIALVAAWRRRIMVLAVVTLLFFAYFVITGFSIGGAYWPGVLLLCIATLLCGNQSPLAIRDQS